MKRLFLVFGTALAILPWFAVAKVHADLIQWSVSDSISTPNQGQNYGNTVLLSRNFDYNGLIALGSPTWQHPITGAFNESAVVATISTYFAAPLQDVLHFGGSLANYALHLTLTDLASGDSGNLTIRGNLSGTVSFNQVNLTNTILSPTTQTLALGQHQYTVTAGSFVPPGPPTWQQGPVEYISQQDGSISVKVALATPEPSSLALACLGLEPLGLAGWFRRRRA
jgi:hypothetical protein